MSVRIIQYSNNSFYFVFYQYSIGIYSFVLHCKICLMFSVVLHYYHQNHLVARNSFVLKFFLFNSNGCCCCSAPSLKYIFFLSLFKCFNLFKLLFSLTPVLWMFRFKLFLILNLLLLLLFNCVVLVPKKFH